MALFQALDWPRWEGISLATGAAQEAERRQPQDTIGRTTARVARYIATARLAFVRVTSQAGSRVRLEDLIGGRVLAGDSPELHVLELGECVVGRFIDNGKGRIWAVSDLLRVAPGAETRVRELALGPLPRRAPDELSGRAALLFRAWAAVAFGDGRSRIEPTAHAGELEDPDETWLDGDAGLHDR